MPRRWRLALLIFVQGLIASSTTHAYATKQQKQSKVRQNLGLLGLSSQVFFASLVLQQQCPSLWVLMHSRPPLISIVTENYNSRMARSMTENYELQGTMELNVLLQCRRLRKWKTSTKQ